MRSMFQKPGAYADCRFCGGKGCLACAGERLRAERADGKKRHYADQFGLPESQIKFFGELTAAQVGEVKRLFTVGLINVMPSSKMAGLCLDARSATR